MDALRGSAGATVINWPPRISDTAASPWEPPPRAAVGVGPRVAVREGPFKGLKGHLSERQETDHALIEVMILGRPVLLEIERECLSDC